VAGDATAAAPAETPGDAVTGETPAQAVEAGAPVAPGVQKKKRRWFGSSE
jgi:hypothetical protein